MKNFSLCFSLFFIKKRDVGVQAIEQLLEKRRNHFDYILLETTGIADPLPIIKMFWLDNELHSDLIFDGNRKRNFNFQNGLIIIIIGLITVIDVYNGLKVKN